MKKFLYKNKIFIWVILFSANTLLSYAGDQTQFMTFFKSQTFKGKVHAFDTLNLQDKAIFFPLIKNELAIIKQKAIADHQFEILDRLEKIEGEIYYINKNYTKAIPIFTKLLSKNKIKSSNDSIQILYILKNAYLNIRNLNKTIEAHRLLVNIQKRTPQISAWILMPRLSTIYYEMKLYKECLREQLHEYPEVKNNTSLLINFFNNRGLYWEKSGNQDSALYWFKKARVQFHMAYSDNNLNLDNEFTLGLIEGNIGQSFMALKQYDKAIPLLKKDVKASKKIKNLHNAGISQLEISKCYIELNQLDLSRKYLDSANILLTDIDDYKTTLNIIKQYAILFDKSATYPQAIEYYKKYILFKDSFDAQNNLKELLLAQVASQVDEKEKLITDNEKNIKEQNIEVSKQKTIRNALLFCGIILIVVVIFISVQLKKTNTQKQLLEIKNKQIETRNEIINQSLHEKDLLIKEVHHRVKNNLQIISSLLKLQSGKSANDEVRNSLREAQDRINSMALLHQLLYRNNQMTSLMFNEYLSNLLTQISASFSTSNKNIHINAQLIDLKLDLDTAIPLGLITNELVSNAYKHAFINNEGEITIELTKLLKNTYQLKISDNGQGLPANFDLTSNDSLGLDIVSILSEQINAQLKIYNNPGTNFEIVFQVV